MKRSLATVAAVVALATSAACGSSSSKPASSPGTSSGSASTQFSPQVQQQIQQVVSTAEQQYHVPGMVVGVIAAGKGSWVQASGMADTSSGQAMTVNSKFKVASITKTFTATVILQLVQQGKLSLTAPISQWVPNVQNAGSITVQMLLNMTSGIYDEGGPGSLLSQQIAANPAQVYTPQQIVALAVSQGPVAPPGQTFYYSDTNYQILGMIAQAVSGQPIQNLISSQILQPLHMNNTTYATSPGVPAPATTGYTVSAQGQVMPTTQPDPSVLGAAGAIITTVGDLQIWLQALGTGKLLNPTTQQQRLQYVPTGIVFSPLPNLGQSTGLPLQYGLGIANAGGFLGHNGQTVGYNSEAWYLPAQQTTIVVLTNADTSAAFGGVQDAADAAFVSLAGIVAPNGITTAPTTTQPPSARRPVR